MTKLSVLFGNRIREIRESKNIKQNKLAEMINFEPTNLSKLEKGAHLPKEDTINKLTEALDCSVKDLFDFAHMQSKQDLYESIKEILDVASIEELRFFYKILISYREIKK